MLDPPYNFDVVAHNAKKVGDAVSLIAVHDEKHR
jgi:hypothetical protein